ncbi:10568_t:CDS:2, partial [Acaulospora morrowiae]
MLGDEDYNTTMDRDYVEEDTIVKKRDDDNFVEDAKAKKRDAAADEIYEIPSGAEEMLAYSIDMMSNAADAIKPFLPFIDIITGVSRAVLITYESSQYNRRTCAALLTRVEIAECAVKSLIRQKEERLKDFRSQNFYKSFVRFTRVMEKIQKFVENISQLSKFRRFISNISIKENLSAILYDFDACSNDLQLSISINIKEQTEKDMVILQNDLEQMTQFLENIDLHVTDIMKK